MQLALMIVCALLAAAVAGGAVWYGWEFGAWATQGMRARAAERKKQRDAAALLEQADDR